MSEKLTQQYLKECLDYDPDTGIFTWKERPREHFKNEQSCKRCNSRFAGKIAGSKQASGYIQCTIDYVGYTFHRLAWFYMTGVWPIEFIDHINRNRSDNRWINLREATNAENNQNTFKASKNNKSGLLGVSSHVDGKFQARIMKDYRQTYLGLFDTAEEAHQTYLEAKKKLHTFSTKGDKNV